MTQVNIWPAPPTCPNCSDWFAGFEAGYLAGDRDGRSQVATERREEQRRIAAQIECSDSVIAGLRAARLRDRRAA